MTILFAANAPKQNQSQSRVHNLATSILEQPNPSKVFSRYELESTLHATYTAIFAEESKKHPTFDKSILAILADQAFDIYGELLMKHIMSAGTSPPPEGAHWHPIVSKLKALWKPDKTIAHPAGASSSSQTASGASGAGASDAGASGASGSFGASGAASSASSSKLKAPKKAKQDETPQGGGGPIEKVSSDDDWFHDYDSDDTDTLGGIWDDAISEDEQEITHNRKNVLDYLSDEELWKIPKDKDGNPLYPPPPRSHTQSWRRINSILSGITKGSFEELILAHVWMHLHYVKQKQSDIFEESIPKDAKDKDGNPYDEAGGPFLSDRRGYRSHPDNPEEHAEILMYGLMQISKSPETAAQAHTCLFVEGLLPCIFVRVRGGAEVGSVDMKGAVEDYNAVLKKAIGDILPHYGYSPDSDKKKWAQKRDELAVR